MSRVALTAASYSARSLLAAAQRCINLYPESNPGSPDVPLTFYGTPGKVLWSTLPGDGPVRCLYQASTGDLFGVRGNSLYRYGAGTWTFLAFLGSYSGPVIAADNSVSVVFVDGSTVAPTYGLTTKVVSFMSGAGWYGADFVCYIDGFLIFNKPASQQFYITGALNLAVDALDFASAEATPDKLVSLLADHRELWLFGERSIEVFGNAGNTFPFERINGATMELGCAAKYSPCKLDNSITWLGADERGDAMVWRAQGYQPVRISTHAIEEEWRTYTRIDDAVAFSYQQSGHSFYVLTFPTAGKTWAFDAATQLWHERAFRPDTNILTRDRANCHVFYNRQHLVGDYQNGNVYVLDLDAYTDNGDVIPRLKSFQHMTQAGKRQFFRSITLDMEAGPGGELNPTVQLRWSDDGGHTWSSTVFASLGKIGQYLNKPHFKRLGSGRDRIFEVSTTAQSKIVLQGAFIEATAGTT